MSLHPETIAAVNAAKAAALDLTLEQQAALLYKAAALLLVKAEALDGSFAKLMTPAKEPLQSSMTPVREREAGMSPAYAQMVAGGSHSTSPPATPTEETT